MYIKVSVAVCEITISTASMSSVNMIGVSQYFLRVIKKPEKSVISSFISKAFQNLPVQNRAAFRWVVDHLAAAARVRSGSTAKNKLRSA